MNEHLPSKLGVESKDDLGLWALLSLLRDLRFLVGVRLLIAPNDPWVSMS